MPNETLTPRAEGAQNSDSTAPSIADIIKNGEAMLAGPEVSNETPEVIAPESTSDEPESTVKFSDFTNLADNRDPFVEAEKLKTTPTKEDLNLTPPPKVTSRDMTGIPKEYHEAFNKMSNGSFAALKPVFLKQKEDEARIKEQETKLEEFRSGKEMLPQSYFEHPEAVTLSPTYKQSVARVNLASSIAEHWKEQYTKLESGEDWQDLNVNAQGEYVLSAAQAGSPQAKATVMANLNYSYNQLAAERGKLDVLANAFKEKHTSAVNTVKQFAKQYFAPYFDPKHPMQPTIKALREFIPAEFKDSPLAELVSLQGAALLHTQRIIQQLQSQINDGTKPVVSNAQRLAGPSDASLTQSAPNSASGTTKEVTMKDFEAVFER